MATILDEATRQALKERLGRLRPEAPAHWGRMNAHRMVCHVADQLRVALGDVETTPTPMFLRFWLPRQILVHWLPWPKGKVSTDPAMLTSRPASWDADVAAVGQLLDRCGAQGPGGAWAPHPAFGELSPREWGRLCAKHLDHHLRQFGV